VKLKYIQKVFAFADKNELILFLDKIGGVLSDDKKKLNCKASIGPFKNTVLKIKTKEE